MVNKSPGRPRGVGTARQRLLDVTFAHFEAEDLERLSARDLAAEAGVSHSLVNYHFGSLDGMLTEAVSVRIAPHQVIARAREATGRIDLNILISGLLLLWEHPDHGPRLCSFARMLAAGGVRARMLSRYLQRSVFDALTEDFGQERARRIATAIVGVVYMRYVLQLPALATLSRQEIGAHLREMMR